MSKLYHKLILQAAYMKMLEDDFFNTVVCTRNIHRTTVSSVVTKQTNKHDTMVCSELLLTHND